MHPLKKTFVLYPIGTCLYAKASRKALELFADIINQDNPEMATRIREWVITLEHEAYIEENK